MQLCESLYHVNHTPDSEKRRLSWSGKTESWRKTDQRVIMEADRGRRGQRRESVSCCADYSDMYIGKQQNVRV